MVNAITMSHHDNSRGGTRDFNSCVALGCGILPFLPVLQHKESNGSRRRELPLGGAAKLVMGVGATYSLVLLSIQKHPLRAQLPTLN